LGQEHPEALPLVHPVVPAACRQRAVPERPVRPELVHLVARVRRELVHLVARVRRVERRQVVPAPDSLVRRPRAVDPDPAVAAVGQAAFVAAVARMHSTR